MSLEAHEGLRQGGKKDKMGFQQQTKKKTYIYIISQGKKKKKTTLDRSHSKSFNPGIS